MSATSKVLLVLLLAVAAVGALTTTPRTLVLVENMNIRNTHSLFFKSLQDRGHQLTFMQANDANLKISEFGVFLFENIILFAPGVDSFGGNVDEKALLEFVDAGRHLLVAVDQSVSDMIREIGDQCGVSFDEQGSVVIDHVNFDLSDPAGDHTLITATSFLTSGESLVVLGRSPIAAPVLYRGIGMAVNEDNALALKILSGGVTTYSADPARPIDSYPQSAGRETLLVAAIQTRNNARVTFAGSIDLFSDQYFTSPISQHKLDGTSQQFPKSGNEQFCVELSKWSLGERGLIKAANVRHRLVDGNDDAVDSPPFYTVKDHVEYSVDLLELVEGNWVPFVAKDVQLEFYRLDPFIRTFLKSDNKGHYTVRFQLPDVYGVFQFRIDYRRLGYGNLFVSNQIMVRPYQHNQFERFIPQAFPYYASAFSMMAGFFLFGIAFLYFKE